MRSSYEERDSSLYTGHGRYYGRIMPTKCGSSPQSVQIETEPTDL